MPMHTGGLSVIPNDKGGIIDDTMITKTADKDGEHIYQVLRLHLFSHGRPVVDTRTSFRSKVLPRIDAECARVHMRNHLQQILVCA